MKSRRNRKFVQPNGAVAPLIGQAMRSSTKPLTADRDRDRDPLRLRVPHGYAVPSRHLGLIEFLHRNRFRSLASPTNQAISVEIYRITGVAAPPRRAGGRWKIEIESRIETRRLDDYRIFPAAGDGPALAAFLEPLSVFGLVRLPGLGLTPVAGHDYAVLRLVSPSAV